MNLMLPDEDFSFDAVKHEYFHKDRGRLPGVTEICSKAGFVKGEEWFTEESRLIGQYAHKAILFWLRGTLDEQQVDPAYAGYLESCKKFMDATGAVPILLERPFYHPLYWYAGTPDIDCRIGNDVWILDFKTGQKMAYHEVQTAAYDLLVPRSEEWGIVRKRGAVYLQENGDQGRFIKHENKGDHQIFIAALTVVRWRENHNL